MFCAPRTAAASYDFASAVDVEAMASFMGRAGSGTGAASRALDPLRSRLRPSGSQRTYLSISHLRSLHIELVALLYSAGATSATPTPSSPPDVPTLSAKQNRRLVEILRSIAELVRAVTGLHLFQTRTQGCSTFGGGVCACACPPRVRPCKVLRDGVGLYKHPWYCWLSRSSVPFVA